MGKSQITVFEIASRKEDQQKWFGEWNADCEMAVFQCPEFPIPNTAIYIWESVQPRGMSFIHVAQKEVKICTVKITW